MHAAIERNHDGITRWQFPRNADDGARGGAHNLPEQVAATCRGLEVRTKQHEIVAVCFEQDSLRRWSNVFNCLGIHSCLVASQGKPFQTLLDALLVFLPVTLQFVPSSTTASLFSERPSANKMLRNIRYSNVRFGLADRT